MTNKKVMFMLSPEEARLVKEGLECLIEQGAADIPDIEALLARVRLLTGYHSVGGNDPRKPGW